MAIAGLADHPAAEACRSLGPEWYLPARDELDTLHNNLADGASDLNVDGITDDFYFNISGYPAGYYWSSSEIDAGGAGAQAFSDGFQDYVGKNGAVAVRCVRR